MNPSCRPAARASDAEIYRKRVLTYTNTCDDELDGTPAAGAPDTVPVETSSVMPDGGAPEETDHRLGATALAIEAGMVVATPTSAEVGADTEIEGAARTVMVSVVDALTAPNESVTVRRTGYAPAAVGVPEMTPVVLSTFMPGGIEVADHVATPSTPVSEGADEAP